MIVDVPIPKSETWKKNVTELISSQTPYWLSPTLVTISGKSTRDAATASTRARYSVSTLRVSWAVWRLESEEACTRVGPTQPTTPAGAFF